MYDKDSTKARRGFAWLPTTMLDTMGIIGKVQGVKASSRPNPKNSSVPATGPSDASRWAAAWSSPTLAPEDMPAESRPPSKVSSDGDASGGCSTACPRSEEHTSEL